MASRTRSSNPRAWVAVFLGLVGVLAVPAAIVLSGRSARIGLLDAAWAVPVAAAGGVGALLFARAAHVRLQTTLERAGGAGRVRTARFLGVIGICMALSGAIAVGFYELLVRLEK